MNMRKILLVFFVALLFTNTSLFAVDFSFGIKGGANLATFVGEDSSAYGWQSSTLKVGFSAGVFGSILLSDVFSIQSSVLYTLKGNAFEFEVLSGYEYYHYSYIEIPILLKYYPPTYMFHSAASIYDVRFNIFAGPYLGINIAAKYLDTGDLKKLSEILGTNPEGDVEGVVNLDYGLVLGIGADYKKFLTEFSVSLGLATVDASTPELDLKNLVFTLMVGYRIL